MAGIIYIASVLYQRGAISIGAITSFLFYMILLLVNFGMVASVFGNVMAILGASDKIVEIMEHKSQVNSTGGDQVIEEELKGTIEIKDVKFYYPSKKDV
jgi:ATP-binding cassette subfamily B protein